MVSHFCASPLPLLDFALYKICMISSISANSGCAVNALTDLSDDKHIAIQLLPPAGKEANRDKVNNIVD